MCQYVMRMHESRGDLEIMGVLVRIMVPKDFYFRSFVISTKIGYVYIY